jgi:hypothetical protein
MTMDFNDKLQSMMMSIVTTWDYIYSQLFHQTTKAYGSALHIVYSIWVV